MSVGRDLARQRLDYIVPLTMAVWRVANDKVAAADLNEYLLLVRDELEVMYDEELIAVLRSTSSVRTVLPDWEVLLRETRELLEQRHGVDKTKQLLVGMV